MKSKKLHTTLAVVACLAIASSATAQAQTLVNFNVDPTGDNGQAVLGGTTDTYNSFGSGYAKNAATAGQTLVGNAVNAGGTATGIAISTSTGFNTYSTAGGSTPNPGFLMDGYAYTATNAGDGTLNGPINLTLSGLTSYDGDAFTLAVYAAGNNVGNGNLITLGGASTATGLTTGASRNISDGVGVAYQTFTGTITGDTLTITATPNDTGSGYPGPFTEVNGFQLNLAVAPEPSTWAMMVGGLGLLFAFGRFRNRFQA